MAGCSDPIPKKPFAITGICYDCAWEGTTYYYFDANGNKFNFSDKNDKYSIGDTIK
jgi:hypothetical protein